MKVSLAAAPAAVSAEVHPSIQQPRFASKLRATSTRNEEYVRWVEVPKVRVSPHGVRMRRIIAAAGRQFLLQRRGRAVKRSSFDIDVCDYQSQYFFLIQANFCMTVLRDYGGDCDGSSWWCRRCVLSPSESGGALVRIWSGTIRESSRQRVTPSATCEWLMLSEIAWSECKT